MHNGYVNNAVLERERFSKCGPVDKIIQLKCSHISFAVDYTYIWPMSNPPLNFEHFISLFIY